MRKCSFMLIAAILMIAGNAAANAAQDALGPEFNLESLSEEQRNSILSDGSLADGSEQMTQALSGEMQGERQTPILRQREIGAARISGADFLLSQIETERLTLFLLSGLAVISLFTVLIFLYKLNATARDVVNGSGLILIIFGTILLVMVVETSEQLTAAIGILGAIAGYLFGSIQKEATSG